ncbi:MAG: hypothetical protein H8F28_00640 [Fibrella sp.]|nr:hypothetical protein [Armatimonadota bacterium]
MTAEEQKAAEEEIIRFQQENPDYWGDQDENGIDITRLRENLSLTPTQRLRKMDAGRNAIHWMRNVRANNPLR